MNLLAYLGKQLKDDDVIELLEALDVQVTYDFDRLHEGQPDKYWAPARETGFQFRFDESQQLDVVFCYVMPSEGFDEVDTTEIGVPIYGTYEIAEAEAKRLGVEHVVSDRSPGWWLKTLNGGYSAHYQYKDGRLFRVTLSLVRGGGV